MKFLVTLATILCLVGCVSPRANRLDAEYLAAGRTALAAVERVPNNDLIIAGPQIGSNAKAALIALGRKVVEPEAVPDKQRYLLPPGYQFLGTFNVSADKAVFEITRGPIHRVSAPVVSLCGATETLTLLRTDDEWKISTQIIQVC